MYPYGAALSDITCINTRFVKLRFLLMRLLSLIVKSYFPTSRILKQISASIFNSSDNNYLIRIFL